MPLSFCIQVWITQNLFLRVNCVKQSKICNRQSSKEQVKQLKYPHLVYKYRTLKRQRPVKQDGKGHKYVLVQSKEHHPTISVIKIQPIKQDQSSQHLELTDDIISSSGCLTALNTPDPDSNMCAIDHVDIIGSIPDSKSPSPFLNH